MNKFLSLVSVLFCTVSCVITDYTCITEVTLVNASSHTVELSKDEEDRPNPYDKIPITLKTGEAYTYSASDMGDKYSSSYLDLALPYDAITVTFDGKYRIVHSLPEGKDMPNNLCRMDSYTQVSSKNRYSLYTYTFTDADYDYAVSQSSVSE